MNATIPSPFTGQVVRRVLIAKLGITEDGYVIGRVRRYIDVGRPDPIGKVDPDIAMVDEPWEPSRPTADETKYALQKKIMEHLTAVGPQRAKEIAIAIDEGYTAVCFNLSAGEGDAFCKVGRIGKAAIWGLTGVDKL